MRFRDRNEGGRRLAARRPGAELPAPGRFCGRFGPAGDDEVLHLLADFSARAEVGT